MICAMLDQIPDQMRQTPKPTTSLDLFCGAGGLTLGLQQSGVACAAACDSWKPAADTFKLNFPGTAFLQADLSSATAHDLMRAAGLRERPTIVAGGPPCQGFSSAGRRNAKDPRNTLVAAFARVVADLSPEFLLFENVEGFLTLADGDAVVSLLDPLVEAGYSVHLRKVNAANFGVPQHRKRVVAIGSRTSEPFFPSPTHTAYGAPGAMLAGSTLPPTPTLAEALEGLPPPSRARPHASIQDHILRSLRNGDTERAELLQPGQRMRDLPSNLQHSSYQRRAFRRVMDGTPSEKRGGAPAGLRRLRGDEPSKAITSAAISEFLNPFEDRYLTVRECARLQTFPDAFRFAGTLSEKATLIGNAVPPRLAHALANSIVHSLTSAPLKTTSSGRLLSFVPTLSSGMSPALQNVMLRVRRRYLHERNEPEGAYAQLAFDA